MRNAVDEVEAGLKGWVHSLFCIWCDVVLLCMLAIDAVVPSNRGILYTCRQGCVYAVRQLERGEISLSIACSARPF